MPRKGENIYKRKDGRWEARYIHHYENGKAKYKSVYGFSYAEAKAKRQAELSKPDNMRVSAVKQLATINEIGVLWLKDRKAKVKESTFARYIRITNNYVIAPFENCRLNKINSNQVSDYFDKLSSSLSDKTVADIRCVFTSIWKYGRENGYPCCDLKLSKQKTNRSTKISILPPDSKSKFEAVLFKYNNLVSLGIVFTLFTGVRIGELCGLQWGDIDFENGYVHICRTVERISNSEPDEPNKTKVIKSEPKTDNSKRIIPLPDFLVGYLREFKLNDEIYILTANTKHTEPHTYYSRYKNFLRKHDLGDYTFHELRHTFATECVEKGFDIKSLSEILGHADVSTTMNLYVHPTLQMKKRQMNMLAPMSYSPSK